MSVLKKRMDKTVTKTVSFRIAVDVIERVEDFAHRERLSPGLAYESLLLAALNADVFVGQYERAKSEVSDNAEKA